MERSGYNCVPVGASAYSKVSVTYIAMASHELISAMTIEQIDKRGLLAQGKALKTSTPSLNNAVPPSPRPSQDSLP